MTQIETVDVQPKSKGGIKSFTFTPSGTNGESHRKNSARKRANHLKNVQTRSSLYKEHTGNLGWNKDVSNWHTSIEALSKGTAN